MQQVLQFPMDEFGGLWLVGGPDEGEGQGGGGGRGGGRWLGAGEGVVRGACGAGAEEEVVSVMVLSGTDSALAA